MLVGFGVDNGLQLTLERTAQGILDMTATIGKPRSDRGRSGS